MTPMISVDLLTAITRTGFMSRAPFLQSRSPPAIPWSSRKRTSLTELSDHEDIDKYHHQELQGR